MIKLEDITKVYGKGSNAFQALKDVDLEIGKGEFVAIMGASGSGKSTLMNILGVLDTPTSGQYHFNSESVEGFRDSKLADFRNMTVGFVFQRFNLLNNMSVFENVALPARYAGLKDIGKKVVNSLKVVGIESKQKNMANELSGGEMQRVAMARALVMSPSIIMADEPTGNLDSKTGVEIMELIDKLHRKGHTVILVTHDRYVANYADRILEIKDGVIVKDYKRSKEL
ncbi:ABC transporter ATP-binding protein [bacterium]|nr:ABC transporter ATP-binding protein [bacterium]